MKIIISIQIFISKDFIISNFPDHPTSDDGFYMLVRVVCGLEKNFQEVFVFVIIWDCPSGKMKNGSTLEENVFGLFQDAFYKRHKGWRNDFLFM